MSTRPAMAADPGALHEQFIAALVQGLGVEPVSRSSSGPLLPRVQALLAVLPAWRSPAFEQAHRGSLANLLAVHLPDNGIAAHPAGGALDTFRYVGPYAGYRDAFYPGLALSPGGRDVAAQTAAVAPAINDAWWGNYGVAVLTDAIRLAIAPSLDTGKLAADLATAHATLVPALTASVVGTWTGGYPPTVAAVAALVRPGDGPAGAGFIAAALRAGQFTGNVNTAIAAGGDATSAATWFLFNLWVMLRAIGLTDVDSVIKAARTAGLDIPAQVAEGAWWSGTYTSWFHPLNGSDVSALAAPAIAAAMPLTETVSGPRRWPTTSRHDEPNGYAKSFVSWGSLANYPPPDTSCFGAGTQVLMADGTTRAIETIVIGDRLQSPDGPRAVILAEAPPRRGRALHRPDTLPVWMTAAHPVRLRSGPARAAIEPWSLIDGLPGLAAGGVVTLRSGVTVAGWADGHSGSVRIDSIAAEPADADDDECVHDLILEGGAPYFVGGPTKFILADAESETAGFDLACTMAVSAALHTAIDAFRRAPPPSDRQLSMIVSRAGVPAWLPESSACAGDLPAIPDASFFLRDGVWDWRTSLLEAQLIRLHARRLRRKLCQPEPRRAAMPGDAWGVCVHDIELLADHWPAGGCGLTVDVRLAHSLATAADAHTIRIDPEPGPRWLITVDTALGFAAPVPEEQPVVVHVTLRSDGAAAGRARCTLMPDAQAGPAEHFVHAADGTVTGRIALSPMALPTEPVLADGSLAPARSTTAKMRRAAELGRALGQSLADSIDPDRGAAR